MSVKVMGRVWDTNLPPNLRLVLLAYADAAEHDGTEIWPGRKRIAKMTGYSVATIDRLTRELLNSGLLVQVQRGHKGQRAAYLIPLTELEAYQVDSQSNVASVSNDTESLSPDAALAIVGDSPPVPDPSSSPVLTHRQRNPWWDELVRLFGEPTTENRRKLYGRVAALVKDQPVSEIRQRAAWIVKEWGPEKLTITSLETHWSRFDAAIGQVSDADVAAFTAEQEREATIERLADE